MCSKHENSLHIFNVFSDKENFRTIDWQKQRLLLMKPFCREPCSSMQLSSAFAGSASISPIALYFAHLCQQHNFVKLDTIFTTSKTEDTL